MIVVGETGRGVKCEVVPTGGVGGLVVHVVLVTMVYDEDE